LIIIKNLVGQAWEVNSVVVTLLDGGADIEVRNYDGQTALHVADTEIVALLRNRGAK